MSIFREDLYSESVVLVTGGGSGIGRGITELFAAHGATTVITSRSQNRLNAVADAIESEYGTECLGVSADVRDEDAVSAVFDATVDAFGRVDVVVNCAAGNFLCPAAALSGNGYRTVLDIDAVGTFNVSRAAFDAWMAEHGGQIINISATLQYTGTPLQVHAASAKAAVDAMTRTLAIEWGPLDIRVNAVAPGPIGDTEGMKRLAPGAFREKLESQIPLRRFGRISEVANTVLFVASPAASYMTGSIVVVDGGQWLAGPGVTPDMLGAG